MQHALEKSVQGIHYSNDKSDLELCQSFIAKLQPTIQNGRRAIKYETLQKLISAGERLESVILETKKKYCPKKLKTKGTKPSAQEKIQ